MSFHGKGASAMAEPRSLPSDAVERLLAAANGDAALLYLHFAAGRPLENAREALRMSEARYDLACATLQQLGLWPQEPQRHLDASQAPVYTEQDVIRETHTSREFVLSWLIPQKAGWKDICPRYRAEALLWSFPRFRGVLPVLLLRALPPPRKYRQAHPRFYLFLCR